MVSLKIGYEIMVNGPYGRWKYVGAPGRFYHRSTKKVQNFKRLFVLVTGKDILSVFSILAEETKIKDPFKVTDLRILYYLEDLEDLLGIDSLHYIDAMGIGRVQILTKKDPSEWAGSLKEDKMKLIKKGMMDENEIHCIAPLPNKDTLVIADIHNSFARGKILDILKQMGFSDDQMLIH
jgi:hypothetical protein